MNKKIWIGFIAVFLLLVLVLGIQMLNEKPEPKQNQGIISSVISDDKEEDILIPKTNEEELEAEAKVENESLAEVPIEAENLVEKTEDIEQSKTPTEESKISDPHITEDDGKFITLSVSAKTLLDKKDKINPEKLELVPVDGWIFPPQKVEFFEGESVFNVLLREMKKNKIHMEYVMAPIYNSNYIEGIGNLYEFDCGELSGWMYAVNDLPPNFGSSTYILEDGDNVKLLYTCDLGRDLGYKFDE